MSIDSIASSIWTRPPSQPQTDVGGTWNADPPPPAGTAATASATGASVAGSTNPFQQLATDIQALLVQAQGGATSTASAAGATGAAAGQAQPHHHHHHHLGGGGTTASSAATTATGSSGTSLTAGDQAASRAFAADIVQALQAYGSKTSGATAPGVTA